MIYPSCRQQTPCDLSSFGPMHKPIHILYCILEQIQIQIQGAPNRFLIELLICEFRGYLLLIDTARTAVELDLKPFQII